MKQQHATTVFKLFTSLHKSASLTNRLPCEWFCLASKLTSSSSASAAFCLKSRAVPFLPTGRSGDTNCAKSESQQLTVFFEFFQKISPFRFVSADHAEAGFEFVHLLALVVVFVFVFAAEKHFGAFASHSSFVGESGWCFSASPVIGTKRTGKMDFSDSPSSVFSRICRF
jgi:hypothetical protein